MTRTFRAVRKVDETGVSGAGHVADGVVFEDGTTVLRWRTQCRSTAVYASFEDMDKIHGHNGATEFVFDDKPQKQSKPDPFEKLDKLVGDLFDQVFNSGVFDLRGASVMSDKDLDDLADKIGRTFQRRQRRTGPGPRL